MKPHSSDSFAFTVGEASLPIPGQARLPDAFMVALLFPQIASGQGYEDIAKQEVLRLGAWLRRRPTSPPWNILRVAPNMERRVRDTLSEAGLQVYVPIETRWPRGYLRMSKAERLRAKPITRPLVPGLVFALLPDDAAIDKVNENQAARLMKAGDGPLKVRPLDIGVLALFEAFKAFDETWSPPGIRRGKRRGRGANSRWKSGQRVKVIDGPFAGFMGEVLRASREDRVEVAIRAFGRETPAELDESWLDDIPEGLAA